MPCKAAARKSRKRTPVGSKQALPHGEGLVPSPSLVPSVAGDGDDSRGAGGEDSAPSDDGYGTDVDEPAPVQAPAPLASSAPQAGSSSDPPAALAALVPAPPAPAAPRPPDMFAPASEWGVE